jgi:hypothetical protein
MLKAEVIAASSLPIPAFSWRKIIINLLRMAVSNLHSILIREEWLRHPTTLQISLVSCSCQSISQSLLFLNDRKAMDLLSVFWKFLSHCERRTQLQLLRKIFGLKKQKISGEQRILWRTLRFIQVTKYWYNSYIKAVTMAWTCSLMRKNKICIILNWVIVN